MRQVRGRRKSIPARSGLPLHDALLCFWRVPMMPDISLRTALVCTRTMLVPERTAAALLCRLQGLRFSTLSPGSRCSALCYTFTSAQKSRPSTVAMRYAAAVTDATATCVQGGPSLHARSHIGMCYAVLVLANQEPQLHCRGHRQRCCQLTSTGRPPYAPGTTRRRPPDGRRDASVQETSPSSTAALAAPDPAPMAHRC